MTSQIPQPFSARAVPPASMSAGQLPVGEYPVKIIAAEIKGSTANENNGMAVFTLQCTQGPNAGIEGMYRLNLFHTDPKVASIAQRQLSALCHVTGVYDVQDLMQLSNREFVLVVEAKPTDQYPNGTNVKGVKDMAGNDPGKTGSGAPAAQTAAPPAAAPAQAWAAPAPAAAAPAPAAGGWAPPAAAPNGAAPAGRPW